MTEPCTCGYPETSWYPENYYIQPHYAGMPALLLVEDAVRPSLGLRRKLFWTKARDAGLAQWSAVGFNLRVRDARKPYGPNRVTLNVAEGVPVDAWHYFEDPAYPGEAVDWIHFDAGALERLFLARNKARMQYLAAHEFGHSLGFGHGGDGIMSQDPHKAKVNDEEAAAAKAYWKLP